MYVCIYIHTLIRKHALATRSLVPSPPSVCLWKFTTETLDALDALVAQVQVFVLSHALLCHPPAPCLFALLGHAFLHHLNTGHQLFLQGEVSK